MFTFVCMLLLSELSAQNGSPKLPSAIDNSFVIISIILMIIFLLIIGLLANVLVGMARYKVENKDSENVSDDSENRLQNNPVSKIGISILLIFTSGPATYWMFRRKARSSGVVR